MASRELPSAMRRLALRELRPVNTTRTWSSRQFSSAGVAMKEAPEDSQDLEEMSSFKAAFSADDAQVQQWDPAERAKGRRNQLPPSRYQFRPPRYNKGPLHPHQPPPKSDPSSREFYPGPFSYTRLEQTYQSMIAPDLMTLLYVHKPPGTVTTHRADRLRTWDDTSPYHKGRPKRGPRGPGDTLRLLEKDVNWRNIPKIKKVTVHSFIPKAMEDVAYLHVGGAAIQAITGVKPEVKKVKHSVSQWGIREGNPVALVSTMYGDMAYDFVDKCINLVFPKIKDWTGISGSTGDSSGNLAWGLTREGAILFPEVSVNYDMYPPKMVPGFHVLVETTATSDRHARLLLAALGVPFTGKYVD